MRQVILKAPYEIQNQSVPIPEPKVGEVRIKIQEIGVCGSDLTIYRGLHPYVSYPLVMGHEFAGTVDKPGPGVTSVVRGQRVAVIPHIVCGECTACKSETYNFCQSLRCTGAEADGAHCDYFCISEKMLVPIPETMSLVDAALMEPACVAYHAAKRGDITSEDYVLIIGAGPIGVFCMQSCLALGAKQVFVADLDETRLEIASNLGAHGVINASRGSIDEGLKRMGVEKIDVFYDCVGEKGHVLNNILKIARRGARVVVAGVLQSEYHIPNLPDFVQHELRLSGTTMYVPLDYREMLELMGKGIVKTDGMVSHTFLLEDIPKVLKMLDKGNEKTFKIVIHVAD